MTSFFSIFFSSFLATILPISNYESFNQYLFFVHKFFSFGLFSGCCYLIIFSSNTYTKVHTCILWCSQLFHENNQNGSHKILMNHSSNHFFVSFLLGVFLFLLYGIERVYSIYLIDSLIEPPFFCKIKFKRLSRKTQDKLLVKTFELPENIVSKKNSWNKWNQTTPILDSIKYLIFIYFIAYTSQNTFFWSFQKFWRLSNTGRASSEFWSKT